MPRTQCLDCGTSVVVDPNGLCPEGHHVGAAGARVAAALGDDRPHPDEPEPWTARVELDEEPAFATELPARRARPIGVPDALTEPEDHESQAVSDELFRELHSLSGLDGAEDHEHSGRGATAAEAGPTAEASVATPAFGGPAPLDVDALAELTALEAAVHSLAVGQDSDDPPVAATSRVDQPASMNGLEDRSTVSEPPSDTRNELGGLDGRANASLPVNDRGVPPPPAPDTGLPVPPAPPAVPEPPHLAPPQTGSVATDTHIDLGNFTARGRRVGRNGASKRRRFGR